MIRVRRYSLAALLFAALRPATAGAAEPEPAAQDDSDLGRRSGLDLTKLRASYRRSHDSRPFPEYVEHKFRVRRDIGRGLVVGAGGFTVLGAFLLSLGYSQGHVDGRPTFVTGWAMLGVCGALYLAGGVLWGVYFRRLEALERATTVSPAARLRLNHAGPILLPHGAGVGLSLAF